MADEGRSSVRRWPGWDRETNPELWDDYARQTVEPGWAGRLSESQVRYIRGVLTGEIRSPHFRRVSYLRARWGFGDDDLSITGAAIRAVARRGVPDDPEHNAELVRQANGGDGPRERQLSLWDGDEPPSAGPGGPTEG